MFLHAGTLRRVRIIAGAFRGRPVQAPRGRATRPTSDRVREALFSILGDVTDLEVLDLFAGSGALGLEALSRGARSVVFVDEARAALGALRANVTGFGVEARARIVPGDARGALRRLAREERRFELVFLDPPYADRGAADLLEALATTGVLAPGAWIVLEHAARDAAPGAPALPEGLEARFMRAYGDTALTFYRAQTEAR